MAGAKRPAAALTAEVGSMIAIGTVVLPGQNCVASNQAVEGGRYDFKRRAVVAKVNPNCHSKDEEDGRGLKYALHHPTGNVGCKVRHRSTEWLPRAHGPRHREIVFHHMHAEGKHHQ